MLQLSIATSEKPSITKPSRPDARCSLGEIRVLFKMSFNIQAFGYPTLSGCSGTLIIIVGVQLL